mgnify:CR=1 FL=1
MVIDVHVHPTGYSLISQDPEERKFRDKVFQRKYDESKLPIEELYPFSYSTISVKWIFIYCCPVISTI